jgi:Uma2 family endonuclease
MSATAQRTQHQTPPTDMPPAITLRLRPVVNLTSDQLLELSSLNDDLRFELTAEGELIVMAPAGGKVSAGNARITAQLTVWAVQDDTGIAFDSSGGFELPNGAKLSPDASWVALTRWKALTSKQQEQFPPLCPDFVIELTSPSDRIPALKRKMAEWIDNGARLGWLIDPDTKRVYVYRPNAPVKQLENPASVSGEPVLPGFTLDLRAIW